MANVPIEGFNDVTPDALSRLLVVAGLNGPIIGTALIPKSADRVSYDNATSGLTATEVQAAIDEIVAGLGTASAEDYEVGTWTPYITFLDNGDLSTTYTNQKGNYRLLGDLCWFDYEVLTSSFTYTTAAGNFRINGLPFTSLSTAVVAPHAAYFGGGSLTINYPNAGGYVVGITIPTTDQIQFNNYAHAATQGFFSNTEAASGSTQRWRGQGHYPVE